MLDIRGGGCSGDTSKVGGCASIFGTFLCLDFLFYFMINTVYAGTFMEIITVLN